MWLDVEPCYVFHPVNATSEDGKVVVDLVVHERVFDADRTGPSEGRPRLERWHLDPLVSSRVRRTRLGDENVEFPRFDERYTASLHHDCWLVVGSDDLSGEHRLVRSDRAHGIQAMRDFGPPIGGGRIRVPPGGSGLPGGARRGDGIGDESRGELDRAQDPRCADARGSSVDRAPPPGSRRLPRELGAGRRSDPVTSPENGEGAEPGWGSAPSRRSELSASASRVRGGTRRPGRRRR